MSSLIMITFIFKLASRPNQLFYGKYYTDTITPDHEGLDLELRPYLLKGISEYHRQDQIQKRVNHFSEFNENVPIGIISVSSLKHHSIHSSNEEINCFDFYCEKFIINHTISLKMYMFGKSIENVTI